MSSTIVPSHRMLSMCCLQVSLSFVFALSRERQWCVTKTVCLVFAMLTQGCCAKVIHHRAAGKDADENQTFNLLQLYTKREKGQFFRTPITSESICRTEGCECFHCVFIFNDTEQMSACECGHFREEKEKKASQKTIKLSTRDCPL